MEAMDWREMSQRIRWPVIALVVLGIAGARASRADLELEQTGQVASLPQPPSPHWAWVGDPVQRRSVLVDLEDGRMLGNLAGGEGLPGALFPRTRRELYMPRTHHSRGDHGERVDALERAVLCGKVSSRVVKCPVAISNSPLW